MHKICVLLTCFLCIVVQFFFTTYALDDCSYFNCNPHILKSSKKIKVLRVFLGDGFGGAEAQVLSACHFFSKRNFEMILLVLRGSKIANQAAIEKVPHIALDCSNFMLKGKDYNNFLKNKIQSICLGLEVSILHWHKPYLYELAQEIKKLLKLPMVIHYHSHVMPHINSFQGVDAFVASSPRIADAMSKANIRNKLGIQYVDFVHPPCDEEKFLNFVPTCSRFEFFKKQFDISLSNAPLLCCIANFWDYKNHAVLLQAVENLIHDDKIDVQLILVGNGPMERDIRNQVQALKLQKNVFLVGFTDLIPEILYYSDIKVLPSKHEAFGRVILEAACMKKPIILSKSADLAGFLIQEGQTGLLFDPSDHNDLVSKIKKLLHNKVYACQLGENVYDQALEVFSSESALLKVEKIYHDLMRHNSMEVN